MTPIQLYVNGRRYHYRAPSSWNEMSRKQLLTWCGLIRQKTDLERLKRVATALLYNIPFNFFKQLNPVQRVELAQTLSFLYETNDLTDNVIGKFWLFRNYFGPGNKLTDLTIQDFRITEIYWQLFIKTDDEMFKRLICATLFKPKGKTDTEKTIANRARLFSLLDPNLIHAVFLFYEGCRAYIHKSFPKVFVAPKGDSAQKSNGISDLEDIILALSGTKFGDFTTTQQTNIYVFLKHLTQMKEANEALERERRRKSGR